MKTLIETTSLLYKRRLVRELNKEENGFYYHPSPSREGTLRASRATVGKDGILRARIMGASWHPVEGPFTDPYGREIVASREAAR